jgi:mRNA interferase MazF
VVSTPYAPDRGDIVWLEYTSRRGHEQSGRRPALVLSPRAYNRKVGLAICCPITSQVKGYPFEVVLPEGIKARGAVLCDQIGTLDWRARRAERLCPAPRSVVEEATAKIVALIDPR